MNNPVQEMINHFCVTVDFEPTPEIMAQLGMFACGYADGYSDATRAAELGLQNDPASAVLQPAEPCKKS